MNRRITASLIFVVASVTSNVTFAQSQIPNTFEAGQPARAAEVNENFDSLDQRIQQLEDPGNVEGQVLTAIPLASEVRYLFAEFFRLNGRFPLDNSEAGAPISSEIQNDFVQSVAINGNVIIAIFGNNANPAIQTDTLEFTPDISGDNVYFSCNPTGNVASYFSQDSCAFVDEPPEPLTTIRKQVVSAIPLASEARWLVEDYYKFFNIFPTDNGRVGVLANEIINNYVTQVLIEPNGVVTAHYGFDANALISGETMTFTATDNGGSISWLCSAPSIADRYTGFSNGVSGCVLPVDSPPQPRARVRQQIESGLSLAMTLQDLAEQFYVANGRWPISNSEAGAPHAALFLTNYVTSISVRSDGQITITFGSEAHPHINGKTNLLTPVDNIGAIRWRCHSSTIEDRYNVFECR